MVCLVQKLQETQPINLSILDFKNGQDEYYIFYSYSINLSILDFKMTKSTLTLFVHIYYKSIHTGF